MSSVPGWIGMINSHILSSKVLVSSYSQIGIRGLSVYIQSFITVVHSPQLGVFTIVCAAHVPDRSWIFTWFCLRSCFISRSFDSLVGRHFPWTRLTSSSEPLIPYQTWPSSTLFGGRLPAATINPYVCGLGRIR